jgi:PAS domain S-box-containing protein
MQRRAPDQQISFSGPIKYSILVSMVGILGLAAILQWTAHSMRKHIEVASLSIFPAALSSQRAYTAFERMNLAYNNEIVLQDQTALDNADREADTVLVALDSAAASMFFNTARSQQIASLIQEFSAVQAKSRTELAAASVANAPPPDPANLAELSQKNRAVNKAFESLQNNLSGDFMNELALVDRMQKMQGILQALLLISILVALFFSIRSLVRHTLQMQEDDLLHNANRAHENERIMLRSLIDNMPDFIYVKDVDSRFVLVNAALARISGEESTEAMLGKSDYDYYPREIADVFFEDEQKLMRSGQPLCNHEEVNIDKEGNTIHVLTTKVPLTNSSGELIGMAGVGRNITSRIEMENALRAAEQEYRGIFDNAIIGVFQSTPDGRIISANPSLAYTLGYDSPEQMIGCVKNLADNYVDPKRREEFKTLIGQCGAVQNFEFESYRKDGCKLWLSVSAVAICQNGEVVRYEGMTQDITERNVLRDQLLQAQKLESVGQLAAGIAHEINTPTQYIGDNVRFLKDAFLDMRGLLSDYERLLVDADESIPDCKSVQSVKEAMQRVDMEFLSDEIPKAIDQALEGVTRVSRLVRAMKEFSHPGTKEKTKLDLNHAIENTTIVARNEWKYVAEMVTDFDPQLPQVSCHPGEFNQVILNLIVNAAHAIADVVKQGGPEKGSITIQTRTCPGWAEIRVQDTGTGIPEKVRSRIFDPFFTTKEIGKGTGQGLAISRSVIVDKLHGSIHFETEEGKGTTFIIRLPFDDAESAFKAVAA